MYGGDGMNTFKLPDMRPRDENGQVIHINNGDMYQGKPYMPYFIALYGVYPSRE
jgi:microcystin-dependent protein